VVLHADQIALEIFPCHHRDAHLSGLRSLPVQMERYSLPTYAVTGWLRIPAEPRPRSVQRPSERRRSAANGTFPCDRGSLALSGPRPVLLRYPCRETDMTRAGARILTS